MTELESLKDYLRIIIDTETNKYIQEDALRRLSAELDSVRSPIDDGAEPVKDTSCMPLPLNILLLVLSIAASAVAGFIVTIIFFLLLIIISVDGVLFDYNEAEPIVLLVGFGALAACVIFSVRKFIKELNKSGDSRRKYEKDVDKHKKRIALNRDLRLQNKQREKILIHEIKALDKQLQSTKNNLEKMYSRDIVYPKYRGLVPVCSIYEYLASGRCGDLGSAYNMYEQEVFNKSVLTGINDVISNLQTAQHSQYILCSELRRANEKSDYLLSETQKLTESVSAMSQHAQEISGKLDELSSSSAVAAYSSEQVQRELDYMNRMNRLAGNYSRY